MTIKTILAAAVLALAPTLVAAECGWSKKINASSCAQGQTFDPATGTCVDKTTS